MGNKRKHKKQKSITNNVKNTDEDNNSIPEDDLQNDEEEQLTTTSKILHTENDSDDGDACEPKRKKKKKKSVATEDNSTDKKNKKSNRQKKKDKFAQRQAELAAAAKDQLKSQCLNYLSQWKHDKTNWKFMKAKQVWLFKNKFSLSLLPNESWSLLMEYFESAKGNIRNMLLEDANKIIKQMDDWTESQNKSRDGETEETEDSEIKKPDDTVYKRARDLIQCLEE